MNRKISIEAERGRLELDFTGLESSTRDTLGQLWVTAIVSFSTEHPVVCSGRCHVPMTSVDVEALAQALAAVGDRDAGPGKPVHWETRDDELELTLRRRKKGVVSLNGRIESGAVHADLHLEIRDLPVEAKQVRQAAGELRALLTEDWLAP